MERSTRATASEPEKPSPGSAGQRGPEAALAAAMALTDAVQAAIDRGDWQEASALEAERRRALETLLLLRSQGQPVPPALDTALASLQRRGHELIGGVHHHRRRLLREAATITTGRRAAAEYENTRHAP